MVETIIYTEKNRLLKELSVKGAEKTLEVHMSVCGYWDS